MFVWSVLFVLAAFFSALYTVIARINALSDWFIILWVVLGILSAALLFIIYVFILIYVILPLINPKKKLSLILSRPIVKWVNSLAGIHLEVEGRENIPSDKTFVAFANHKSMLDITIMYLAINKPISAVAKSTLSKVPVLRKLVKNYKAIYVDRNNDREAVKSLLVAIKNVENGLNYFIFPEGGIKSRETEKMVDIKPGAYKLATKPQALILPITINGSSKLTERAFKKRTNIKVIIHKPITPEEYNQYNTQEIGEKMMEIINGGLINE